MCVREQTCTCVRVPMWQREEEKTHWHSVGSGKCHSPIDDHAVGHDVLSGDRVRIPRADRRIRHDEILLLSSYAASFPETGHEASSLSRMWWVRLGTPVQMGGRAPPLPNVEADMMEGRLGRKGGDYAGSVSMVSPCSGMNAPCHHHASRTRRHCLSRREVAACRETRLCHLWQVVVGRAFHTVCISSSGSCSAILFSPRSRTQFTVPGMSRSSTPSPIMDKQGTRA